MAAVAACRRLGRLRTNSGVGLTGFAGYGIGASKFSPSISGSMYFSGFGKSNGQRLFLVDTLALVKRLEGQGVPLKQAEAITGAITEVLNDSLENVSRSLVSKEEMQRTEMQQEANLSKFKTEVQSSQNMQEAPAELTTPLLDRAALVDNLPKFKQQEITFKEVKIFQKILKIASAEIKEGAVQ